MSDPKENPGKPAALPHAMQFHYIKSAQYRVVAAEGAIGSITPQGKVFLSLYNERVAIPRLITQAVKADGTLGDVLEMDTRQGMVREVEVGIILDRTAAEALKTWLGERVAELDAVKKK